MDKETCEKLYTAYYMRVYSYVMTLCGSADCAEEITQQTFYRVFTSQSGFRGESEPLTWLCAAARNLYTDEVRRQSRRGEFPDEAPGEESVEQVVSDRDASFRIHRALHALEEPYREVFELRVFGELSFRQIGTVFGKTENWARVTYRRAKLKLQERMDEK